MQPKLDRIMKQSRSSTGFTVVELIVVIVIIAILATISLVGYEGIQKDARDKERFTDIEVISSALEDHFNKNGFYPKPRSLSDADIASLMKDTLDIPDQSHKAPNLDSSKQTSVSITSNNPIDASTYSYHPEDCDSAATTQCSKYTLLWKKEKDNTVISVKSRYGW